MIKCACGDENCKIGIHFEDNDGHPLLMFHGKDGYETSMYCDVPTLMDIAEAVDNLLCDMIVASEPKDDRIDLDDWPVDVPERLRDEV